METRTWYSTAEAARLLGLPPSTVAWAFANGRVTIPRVRVANALVLDAEGVRRLADHFGVEPPCACSLAS
jgi:hypothetical protein